MTQKVFVVGVGMTKFTKPSPDRDYPEMGKEAVEAALTDAGVKYDIVQQAVCGYARGDSTCGQRVLYQVGMTGIPIYNVNNNCATGSTALFLAKQLVEGGISDVVLAVGFEKMAPGALAGSPYKDRTHPLDKHTAKMVELAGMAKVPMTPQFFGNAGIEYMKKYGTTELHVAKVAAKNHRHGAKNPRAQGAKEYTVDEVLNSRKIFGPLTKLACCPTSDGAGAAVLMSERAVVRFGLQNKAVEIVGMEMATDTAEVFTEKSLLKVVGYDMTALAAKRLYEKTKVSPRDVNVVELHDCFATTEMFTYEGLQLCGVGQAGKFIDDGDNTYGGRVVVNPSGGLIAKGHPLGATGLAQCAELVWQLRGEAGDRQDIEPYEEREGNKTHENPPYLHDKHNTSTRQETSPNRGNCQNPDKMRCRFPRIQAMLRRMKEGCVDVSLASLTPFNRGVSLFARSRFCVNTAGT